MTSHASAFIVLLAHGSPDPRSSAAARELASAVGIARPGFTVEVAFLDNDEPSLEGLVTRAPAQQVVVVPMFLSSAFHARVDVPAAVEQARQHCPAITVTDPLGHDPRIRRWVDEQLPIGMPLVMATAGTRNADAQVELADIASTWALERETAVVLAYAAMAEPSVAAASAVVAWQGAVAAYVLFPGIIDDRIGAAAGGLPTSRPLCACPALVDVIWERVDDALGVPLPPSHRVGRRRPISGPSQGIISPLD